MGWVGVTPKKNVAYFFVQDGLFDHDFWREKNTGRIGAGFLTSLTIEKVSKNFCNLIFKIHQFQGERGSE